MTVGREVRVDLPGGGTLTGRATGIDAGGRLGRRRTGRGGAVGAGDVVHVRSVNPDPISDMIRRVAISQKLLNDGETVVISTRTHPKALLLPVLALVVLLALGVAVQVLVDQTS